MAASVKRDSMDVSTLTPALKAAHVTPPESNLSSLPVSVRNKIYAHILDTELINASLEPVSYTPLPSSDSQTLAFRPSRTPFPVQTSLFYTNHHISLEAQNYFYATNLFVRLTLYTADISAAEALVLNSGVLFAASTPDVAAACTQHVLDVSLTEGDCTVRTAAVLFPAQYLPRLVNYMREKTAADQTWPTHHSLAIALQNTYTFPPSRLQGDVLEPFRALHSFHHATIAPTHVLAGYATGLASALMQPAPSADTWLSSLTHLSTLSDAARAAEDYTTAAEYSHATTIALTYGFLTRTLPTSAAFARSAQRLRWHTELSLGISLTLAHRALDTHASWLHDAALPLSVRAPAACALLVAETALSRALSLATDAPSPASNPWFATLPAALIPLNRGAWFSGAERAQTWYALGVVQVMLGEFLFGAGALARALVGWAGAGKERVECVFAKARAGVDRVAAGMVPGLGAPGEGLRRARRVAEGV